MTTEPVAIVTGGNRGIGLEVARGLARAGLRVIVGARRPAPGGAGEAWPLDLAQLARPARVVGRVQTSVGRGPLLDPLGAGPSGRARAGTVAAGRQDRGHGDERDRQ